MIKTRQKIAENTRKTVSQLPQSWIDAAGILKKIGVNPLEYQKKIRQGWGKHIKNLKTK